MAYFKEIVGGFAGRTCWNRAITVALTYSEESRPSSVAKSAVNRPPPVFDEMSICPCFSQPLVCRGFITTAQVSRIQPPACPGYHRTAFSGRRNRGVIRHRWPEKAVLRRYPDTLLTTNARLFGKAGRFYFRFYITPTSAHT